MSNGVFRRAEGVSEWEARPCLPPIPAVAVPAVAPRIVPNLLAFFPKPP